MCSRRLGCSASYKVLYLTSKREVTSELVLVAIFSEKEAQAVHLRRKLGINRFDVASVIGSEYRGFDDRNPTTLIPDK